MPGSNFASSGWGPRIWIRPSKMQAKSLSQLALCESIAYLFYKYFSFLSKSHAVRRGVPVAGALQIHARLEAAVEASFAK